MRTKTIRRRTCGTMEEHKRLLRAEPLYRQNRLRIESFTLAHMETARAAARVRVVTIPVVVHVLYNKPAENISLVQIQSQIDTLNLDYRKRNADIQKIPSPFAALAADARVQFRLAVRDPNNSPTDGITRTHTTRTVFHSNTNDIKHSATGGHDAWPRDQYLNLWAGPNIVDPVAGALLGYAQFPGGPAATDGVVITTSAFGSKGTAKAPYNKGRTATHEIGHWLNLLHIWGDDNGGCSGSDSVTDTPNQAGPNFGSPSFPSITCNNGPQGDMFMNYMDYTDDAGMFMFTRGQVTRMRAALNGPRAGLLSSNALKPAARIVAVALKGPPRPISIRRLVGREAGTHVTRVFNGASWVPVSRRRASRSPGGR
jgi:Pregnancy-associated plasma protein-A